MDKITGKRYFDNGDEVWQLQVVYVRCSLLKRKLPVAEKRVYIETH